jgi:hypothetical protein
LREAFGIEDRRGSERLDADEAETTDNADRSDAGEKGVSPGSMCFFPFFFLSSFSVVSDSLSFLLSFFLPDEARGPRFTSSALEDAPRRLIA